MRNETKDRRGFGIAMGVVLTAVGIWQRGAGRPTLATVLLAAGAAFLLAAILAPRLLAPILAPWRRLSMAMGFVTTRVVLAVFFVLVITPAGLVRRMLGRDSLDRGLDVEGPTWWRERAGARRGRERYERQY